VRDFLLSAWLLTAAAAPTPPAHASGSEGPESVSVRVLLFETSTAVSLGETRVEPALSGLRVDGVEVGDVWEANAAGPIRVGDHWVQGRLAVRRAEAGLWVVNHVPLERYVEGTLAGEVYESWEFEMLKAQAVAVRSFALYRCRQRREQAYDVSAGTEDQVFVGVEVGSEKLRGAVHATEGEVLVHAGQPILAVFHSASGGRTASAEEVWGRALPYLVSLEVVDEEESPDTYWRARLPGPTLERALGSMGLRTGQIREVRVAERSQSGRAGRLWVAGDRGSGTVSARELRSQLGDSLLRSTLFEVFLAESDVLFVGSGHGHGVGMSQWGGQAMAHRGATYREILEVFYPGTQLLGGASQ